MKTCRDYLKDLKLRYGIESDYQLAKLLGLRKQTIGSLQAADSTFSVETAMRVAELLGIDPKPIVVQAHLERARSPAERKMWESLLGKVAAIAVGAVGLAAIATYPADVIAAVRPIVCVLC